MVHNAIELAIQRGWKLFPLIPRSRFATEQDLLRKATSSIEQIEEWQKQYPDCAWALATGEQSGVFVVECSLDLGVHTLRAHSDSEFAPEDTLHILTPKWLSIFFRWPDGGLPKSRRAMLAQGVYVRKEGGYIELPLTGDQTNGGYAFRDPHASIYDAPSWLLNLIHAGFSNCGTADATPFPNDRGFSHIVGMSFTLLNNRWVCNFFRVDDTRMIVKTLYFRSAAAILALAERGGMAMSEANTQWLYSSIRNGEGNLLLTLNGEQYSKLLAA